MLIHGVVYALRRLCPKPNPLLLSSNRALCPEPISVFQPSPDRRSSSPSRRPLLLFSPSRHPEPVLDSATPRRPIRTRRCCPDQARRLPSTDHVVPPSQPVQPPQQRRRLILPAASVCYPRRKETRKEGVEAMRDRLRVRRQKEETEWKSRWNTGSMHMVGQTWSKQTKGHFGLNKPRVHILF